MEELKNTFEFSLDNPIRYHHEGRADNEALFITCYEPTGSEVAGKVHKHMRRVTFALDQAFMNMANKREKVKSDDEAPTELSNDDMVLALRSAFLSGDLEEYEQFLEYFKTAVVAGELCKLADIIPMNSSHWDMLADKQDELALQYCCFFAIGLLADLKTS